MGVRVPSRAYVQDDPLPVEGRQAADAEVARFERLMLRIGRALPPGARVLDFGCGSGEFVAGFARAGYDAWGCDIVLPDDHGERLLPIEQPYRLPFPDSHFDFICSMQVLEHVQDHDEAFGEVARVLRPGAASIHIFPPPLAPLEQHTFVPLGGVLQAPAWLSLWARLGVRNSFQDGLSAAEVARVNREFLTSHTQYLGRRDLLRTGRRHFTTCELVVRDYLAITRPESRWLIRLVELLPPAARLYGTARSRVLLAADPSV